MAVQPNIPSLTGLRFYAAAIITYCHGIEYFFRPVDPRPLVDTVSLGSIGMTLFFVLSGFVIHYNYGNSFREHYKLSIRTFAVARFARLYPLYFFSLALTLAFIPNPYVGNQLWSALPYYITLTQDWFHVRIGETPVASLYVGQAWSISAEILLYFMYIPFARAICAFRSTRAVLAAVVFLLVTATGFNLGRTMGYWMRDGWDQYVVFYMSPYCRFSEFLLGALAAALYQRRASSPAVWLERWPLLAASLVGMVALFAASYTPQGHLFRLFEYSWGFAPSCGGLIYYFARNRGRASWIVESKPVILFGDASYSLYMLSVWSLWMFSANGVSPNYGQATFRMFMALMFLALLSLGSYQYFEVPLRRFIRKKMGGQKLLVTTERSATLGSVMGAGE
jgi:peptidoglycan/LPS O-acetylase OafA/YrhL